MGFLFFKCRCLVPQEWPEGIFLWTFLDSCMLHASLPLQGISLDDQEGAFQSYISKYHFGLPSQKSSYPQHFCSLYICLPLSKEFIAMPIHREQLTKHFADASYGNYFIFAS